MIKQITLKAQTLIGSLILITIITSLFSTLRYANLQKHEIESSINEINKERLNVNLIYQYIIELATLSESIMIWNESDYYRYHQQRLKIDNILLKVEYESKRIVDLQHHMDSLHILLEAKEMHLFKMMKAIQYWKKIDSLQNNEFKQAVKMKTITRKKKGIAGLFGKKENILVPCYTFNKELISAQNCQNNRMEVYADSLYMQNQLLNHKLYDLVSLLDNQIQQSFSKRNKEITKTRKNFFQLFTTVIIVALLLFITFFFIIRRDLSKEKKIKLKLRKAIDENENLLEMRNKIILTVSHDIRGPLGNIHNCADLASETREKKKREIYLEDIRHSCHHILHLVNNLMDAYRINETGDLHNDTPFYLDRFLKRISDEFSRKAVAKALYLQSEHQNSSFVVKGDADKLEQVLANLLTNAIKFTPS